MKNISSLYLHFPFCRHLCNYCDFYKRKLESEDQIKQFENLLTQQITEHCNLLSKYKISLERLNSLYIGGGTPSLWSRQGPEFINKYLFDQNVIDLNKNCEFTIEVDPGEWTSDEISKWEEIGVNRFSIGAQSFDDQFLKLMDRRHNRREIIKLLEFLKSKNANYSIDLMLGLPKSDIEGRNVLKELEELMKFNPTHFSVYILKTRSNYPLNSMLPDEDFVSDEYLTVCSFMEERGYQQYEVSNFAKPGYESTHNKKYWTYESIAAIGPNASGLLVEKDQAVRYQWKSQSNGYKLETLNGTSLLIEQLYMALRAKNTFLAKNYFKNEEELEHFDLLVEDWKELGYVVENTKYLNLSAKGYLMLDSLINDIFNRILPE